MLSITDIMVLDLYIYVCVCMYVCIYIYIYIYIYIFPGRGVATHSSILAWRIPWTEEPGRLQSETTEVT